MKLILQDNNHHILRFDKDEEVIAGLIQYAKENNIRAAQFSGIGACATVELGYFNTTLKDYRKKPYFDNKEIVSLLGNIAGSPEGEPVVHAHGSFSDNDFGLVAGHVFKLTVSVTCEISLAVLEGQMQRQNNSDFNLNLLG